MDAKVDARGAALQQAALADRVDVLIIGAGINGAGTFRDLCINAVPCLLVDAEDFGAGATSASTRIAHGGLRYLENGEIRLVAEATRERNRLLRNAPHYVSPLLITIPSFSRFGGTFETLGKLVGIERPIRSRGLLLIKAGLTIYDWLGRRERALPRNSVIGRRRGRRLLPSLNPDIKGVASYYDARISHAERLAYELVADGLAACPSAIALNHCRVISASGQDVALRDEESGTAFSIRPRIVVNASGAWIDVVNASLERGDEAGRLIGGTKGSHILVENAALREAMGGRCFSYDDGSGRMCVAYALGELVLLGSSDIRVDSPAEAVCSDDEVHYFLRTIRLIFPSIDVNDEQIRYRFCGVRPLPFVDTKNTVDISRDHSIVRDPPTATRAFPILSLIGGKWTTFRAFSEQVTDRAIAELGRSRRASTRDLPIGGGKSFPDEAGWRRWIEEISAEIPIGAGRLETLLRRYGSTGRRIAAFCASRSDAPLPAAPSYSDPEIRYLVRFEMARNVEDLVYRRTMLAMEGQLSFALLVQLASIVIDEIGLKAGRGLEAQLAPIVARLTRENGVDFTAEMGQFSERLALAETAP